MKKDSMTMPMRKALLGKAFNVMGILKLFESEQCFVRDRTIGLLRRVYSVLKLFTGFANAAFID